MADETTSIPLIHTKLHRPPVVGDHVHRPHLLERLDQRRQRPLTLVSAPAGYGKSTLVSCWLEACDIPSAWLSLDENDNDLRLFLACFVAAVQTIFPGVCCEIQAILRGPDLPPVKELVRSLINELDQADHDFILALDDYHFINERAVHDLLLELLQHPPEPMHLVLAARRDPPLPLATLRARGQLTEIRVQDLRFSAAEIRAFLPQLLQMPVDDTTAALLEERTEGWVTGLRLAALSMRHQSDSDHILRDLPLDNRYVMDYIVAEVLSHQPSAIQKYLLTTAILDRFCAPLCEAVCLPESEPGACEMGGQQFLEWLQTANLFVIPLDEQSIWYRYHHLFQKLLQSRLKRRFSQDDIDALHKRASRWFDENGWFEEALHHALEGDDIGTAVRLVTKNRHNLMNQEQWHRIDRWLYTLPADSVEKNPELLIQKAWICENRLRLSEMVALTKEAEALIVASPSDSNRDNHLLAELDALNAARYYLEGDGKRAVAHAQHSLEGIPLRHASERAFALVVLSLAHQMTGELNLAQQVVNEALERAESYQRTYHLRLLTALCFIYWLEGDLSSLNQTAAQLLRLGVESGLLESISFGHYFLGIVAYELGALASAENHLVTAVGKGYKANINTFAHGAFALALTYHALGKGEEASEVAESVVNHALATHNPDLLKMASAFQAELDVRQGRKAKASLWARQFDPYPLVPVVRFYTPQLTLAKALLAEDTADSRHKAADLLTRLHDFYVTIHNKRCLIDVLALQALLHHAQGEEAAALSALERAITLAEPGGFIRLFVDLGSKMATLLNRMIKQNVGLIYSEQLLAAFGGDRIDARLETAKDQATHPSTVGFQPVEESLSIREMEILALLPLGLRNKEIAEKLFISPETVKKHTINIYRKLRVNSRQKAVARAYELGILARRA